nr:unnamed protein product [Spirometra erinaceieuropaei]
MDDERLSKRLFCGDLSAGSRLQGQVECYKDTLKTSLRRLHINTDNREDLTRDRPTWRRTVKTGAGIYDANRIAAAKARREALKFQLPPTRNANAQPPSDLSTLSADVPGTKQSHWTSLYQLRHPEDTTRCPPVHICLALPPPR